MIEHLELADGLGLVLRLVELLEPGGVLILQTPNARCVRNPMANDMTHLQIYNLGDLWAYLSAHGLEAWGYRVVFTVPKPSATQRFRSAVSAWTTTRLLGMDYAENILVMARKAGKE